MNVLITGSNGFVGKNLLLYLEKNFPDIHVFGWLRSHGNLNTANFEKHFDTSPIHKVIHLASHTKVVESWEHPQDYFIANPKLTLDALEFCKSAGAGLVFISSYLYGNAEELPIDENAPVKVNNPYAFSKLASENICRFYSENSGIPVTILRPFNIYGPGQDAYFLIPKIAREFQDDRLLHINVQNLHTRRDYLYIDDFCRAIALSLNLLSPFEILNLGAGFSVSVEDIILLLQKISGKQKNYQASGETRKNEILDVVADISKARRLLGWEPVVSLEEGLKKVYTSL